MKENMQNNEVRERQAYVPASVKVINVTTQRIICSSDGSDITPLQDNDDYNNLF